MDPNLTATANQMQAQQRNYENKRIKADRKVIEPANQKQVHCVETINQNQLIVLQQPIRNESTFK